MRENSLVDTFIQAARQVGATVVECDGVQAAVDWIGAKADGALMLPAFASGERLGLRLRLQAVGCKVLVDDFRQRGPQAAAGVTGSNFALADTGTVILASTDEAIRLASTLPKRHFLLLDPGKIVSDGPAAVPLLRQLQLPGSFVAAITGPSRTADIERVLTIGVHGPSELHILLLAGFSADPLEL